MQGIMISILYACLLSHKLCPIKTKTTVRTKVKFVKMCQTLPFWDLCGRQTHHSVCVHVCCKIFITQTDVRL